MPGCLPEAHSSLMFARLGRNFPFSREQAADTNVGLLRFQEGKGYRKYDRGKGTAAFPSPLPGPTPHQDRMGGLEKQEGRSWLQSNCTSVSIRLEKSLAPVHRMRGVWEKGNTIPYQQDRLSTWSLFF